MLQCVVSVTESVLNFYTLDRVWCVAPHPSACALLRQPPSPAALRAGEKGHEDGSPSGFLIQKTLLHCAHADDFVERAHGWCGFIGVEDLTTVQVQLQPHAS